MRNYHLLSNPFAQFSSDIDLPGLKARAGQEYHYPYQAPDQAFTPISSAKPAPGWSILPGWVVSPKNGKRQQVFKLVVGGKDTGKYALTAEAAAELSYKLDPVTLLHRKPSWLKPKAQANPRGGRMLSRARALNTQYDRDNYTGSSRSQLRQARQLETSFDDNTETASPRQLSYARQLESQYDQDDYTGSSAAQLELARRLEAEFDMANDNPVWVTRDGTAIRHTDQQWAGYQAKNKGARLPAQASREADLEAQTRVIAPGWSTKTTQKQGGSGKPYTAYCLYYMGKDTGKYALDMRKAIEISWNTDPETGKRKGR